MGEVNVERLQTQKATIFLSRTANFEVDGLRQKKILLGFTSVRKEQKAEAAVGTGGPKTGQLKTRKKI